MSRRLACTLALVSLCACGPETHEPGFDLTLAVTRGLLDQIGAFQVSVVTSDATLDCVAVEKKCLVGQVDASRFIPVRDASGKQARALLFPIKLVAGTPNTQDISVQGVPLGKDYAVVVEALSKDSPPRLAGSSCNYVREVTAGTNAAIFAHISLLTPAASCDPRVTP